MTPPPEYDEDLYEEVLRELARDGLKNGLWAKAFSEANGAENVARANYLRLRVAQLAAERAKGPTQPHCEHIDGISSREDTQRPLNSTDRFVVTGAFLFMGVMLLLIIVLA